jgi:hypothetical protein
MLKQCLSCEDDGLIKCTMESCPNDLCPEHAEEFGGRCALCSPTTKVAVGATATPEPKMPGESS